MSYQPFLRDSVFLQEALQYRTLSHTARTIHPQGSMRPDQVTCRKQWVVQLVQVYIPVSYPRRVVSYLCLYRFIQGEIVETSIPEWGNGLGESKVSWKWMCRIERRIGSSIAPSKEDSVGRTEETSGLLCLWVEHGHHSADFLFPTNSTSHLGQDAVLTESHVAKYTNMKTRH